MRGLRLRQLAEICAGGANGRLISELAAQLRCTELLSRDVHLGFSGGEIKKAEILQVMAQRPALALIDEPDAGVDLDNIGLVGEAITRLLAQPTARGIQPAGLIITHTGSILSFVRADVCHVLYDGTLVAEAQGSQLLEGIKTYGYGRCPLCRARLPVP